jgi:NAD(P)H-hydrate epimerase
VSDCLFRTEEGILVPAVTAEQMREVDRIAVEVFNLGILQMMENAGRNLAQNVLAMLGMVKGEVAVLAGSGGNGGGGLCCARHLHNRGIRVWVVLDREASTLTGSALRQLQILQLSGLKPIDPARTQEVLRQSQVIVDALIGYGLQGAPKGRTAELIELCNQYAGRALSLDVPSGLNSTTGEIPGIAVQANRTMTLALPKTGLRHMSAELYLADIGIPPEVFQQLRLAFDPPFGGRYWVRLGESENN